MNARSFLFLLTLPVFLFAACNPDEDQDPSVDPPNGGQVYTPTPYALPAIYI